MKHLISLLLLCAALHAHAQSYIGRGSAMAPNLADGESVYVESSAYADLKPGTLVAFRHNGDLVVSRLVNRTADGWLTKADAKAANDPDLLTSDLYVGTIASDEIKPNEEPNATDWYLLSAPRDYWYPYASWHDGYLIGVPTSNGPHGSTPGGAPPASTDCPPIVSAPVSPTHSAPTHPFYPPVTLDCPTSPIYVLPDLPATPHTPSHPLSPHHSSNLPTHGHSSTHSPRHSHHVPDAAPTALLMIGALGLIAYTKRSSS